MNMTTTNKPANKTAYKIASYEFRDVVRGKGVLGYAFFFFLITSALLQFSGGAKAILSLANVSLIIVPLVCLLFGTIYLYNARNFVQLILVQPLTRQEMFAGLYVGLAGPLAAGFVAGVTLPFLLRMDQWTANFQALSMLLVCGVALTLLYTSIAFLIATIHDDKTRGLSTAFMVWFLTSVLYDGLLLLMLQAFASYPIEVPALVAVFLNPTDLARILLMMQFDISAMMGYTGAVFESFFGSNLGLVIVLLSLLVWIGGPLWLARRRFLRMDY